LCFVTSVEVTGERNGASQIAFGGADRRALPERESEPDSFASWFPHFRWQPSSCAAIGLSWQPPLDSWRRVGPVVE
jgi:hypothetical protein